MNTETKRTIRTAGGILLVIVAVIVYVGIYRLPVLRYAHQIFPLSGQSDTVREYQKDVYSIRIAETADSAEIRFSDPSGREWQYTVSQDGYLVTACNERQETLLSGFWQGKRLRQVIVRPQSVTLQLILLGHPRSQKKNRHATPPPHSSAQREAVQLGQHHIQQNRIVFVFIKLFHGLRPVGGGMQGTAVSLCGEIICDNLPQARLILHQ